MLQWWDETAKDKIMDLMVDIETLGTHNDSIILTIGAQMFDPSLKGWETRPQRHIHTGETFSSYMNVRVDVDEQEALGRTTDQGTLDWWAKQSAEAQAESFSEEDRLSLRESLTQLVRLAEPCKRVWSKGAFDFIILEHALEQLKMPIPWRFYHVRDCRTVFSLTPKLTQRTNGHLAIEDCRNQILMLQDAFTMLGVEQLK
jgi:hypothetical protein